jgi:hypothetical protein
LSHSPKPVCSGYSGYFGDRVSLFALAGLDQDPILHFLQLFSVEMESGKLLPWLAWSHNPPDVSHPLVWDDRRMTPHAAKSSNFSKGKPN